MKECKSGFAKHAFRPRCYFDILWEEQQKITKRPCNLN